MRKTSMLLLALALGGCGALRQKLGPHHGGGSHEEDDDATPVAGTPESPETPGDQTKTDDQGDREAPAPAVLRVTAGNVLVAGGRNSVFAVVFSAPMSTAAAQEAVSVVPALDCGWLWQDTTLYCLHEPLPPGERHEVAVAASAVDSRGRALAAPYSLSFAAAAGAVSEVTVFGTASHQARQGTGEVILVVRGTGFSNVRAAKLDDEPVAIRSGATDAEIAVTTSVPHGASVGGRDLELVTDGEPVQIANALVVTPITATAAGDDAGTGTRDAPYRTLTKALAAAAEGDRVELGEGTFSEASGEAWPALGGGNAPGGIEIAGRGAKTQVRATSGAGKAAIVAAAGTVTLYDLDIAGFEVGILARGTGQISGMRVDIHDNTADGGRATDSARIGLTSSRIHANGNAGARATGHATLSLSYGRVDTNRTVGVRAEGDTRLTLLYVEVDHNGVAPAKPEDGGVALLDRAAGEVSGEIHDNVANGVYKAASGELRIKSAKIHDNTEMGVRVPASGAGVLYIEATDIDHNVGTGIYLTGAGRVEIQTSTIRRHNIGITESLDKGPAPDDGTLRIRNTEITGNWIGLNAAGVAHFVDLGTATSPGYNKLRGNSYRQVRITAEGVVAMSKTIFDASATGTTIPAPQVVFGVRSEPSLYELWFAQSALQFN